MQKQNDITKLKENGILSDKAIKELEKQGGISKKSQVTKRYIQTSEGSWVEPSFYFRGGSKTTLSNEQEKLVTEINKLITKYTIE